jgi:hypothetical protein
MFIEISNRRKTMEFEVLWIIDIEADTPQEAASKALTIQRDPESIATCFTVTAPGHEPVTIDFDEPKNQIADKPGDQWVVGHRTYPQTYGPFATYEEADEFAPEGSHVSDLAEPTKLVRP